MSIVDNNFKRCVGLDNFRSAADFDVFKGFGGIFKAASRASGGAESTLAYRMGGQVDRLMILRHKEEDGDHRHARLFYRILHTLRTATHDLFDSVSFALFMLVLAICAIFVYILLVY